jgi:hypothetical protein
MRSIVTLLLLICGELEFSFAKWAPNQRPTTQAVQQVLGVNAWGTLFLNADSGSGSYLTRWHPGVVLYLDWQRDNNNVARVTWLKVRLRTENDGPFGPFPHRPLPARIVTPEKDPQMKKK